MALFEFSGGSAMFDATSIENMFFLEFMPSAPDGFLKAYLYARMLVIHPELGTDTGDIAKTLHMEPGDVENAFLYWERQGLMQKTASNPPSYVILPLRSDGCAAAPMERCYYEYRDYTAALQAIFGEEDLLHGQEYRLANDWLNVLGLDQPSVLYLVEREKKISKAKRAATVFKRVDKLAARLADRGAKNLTDVQRLLAFDDSITRLAESVLKRLAIRRQPTEDELALVKKWAEEWNLDDQAVLNACEETVRSRQPSLAYLDKILETRVSGNPDVFEQLKSVLAQLGESGQPTPDQHREYAQWMGEGFQPRTVELAAIQLNRRKKHSFSDLEWLIGRWRDSRLFNADDAEAYIRKNSLLRDDMRRLLETAGSDRNPNMGDLEILEQWRGQHSSEMIECAAECARGTQQPVRYMDKLLSEWAVSGIRDAASARAQHAAHGRPETSSSNPALNYQQRTYTEEDFGDDFFFDPETQRYGGKQS